MGVPKRVIEERVRAGVLTLAVVAALAGCALGPDYRRPEVRVPTAWRTGGEGSGSLAELQWSQVFQDPVLQDLINIALTENKDLNLAVARVAEARAKLGITRAAQFPQIDGQASYTNQRYSQNSFPFNALGSTPGISPQTDYYRTGIDMNFELDLWGRLREIGRASCRERVCSTV